MEVLERLTEQVEALARVDATVIGEGKTLVELDRLIERLHAVRSRATAAFDASRTWANDGARTAAAWLRTECRLPDAAARKRAWLARTLRHMPATEAAWIDGELNEYTVALLAKSRCVAPEPFAEAEESLVTEAKRLRFRDFGRLNAYWRYCADTAAAEADATAARESRRFCLSQSFEGMWFGDVTLDPVSGEIVSRALRGIDDELFAADWAEAKERVGDSVTVDDLARTPSQRRADALVEMARRSGAVPAGSRRPAPLFGALIDCRDDGPPRVELGSGTTVTPGSLVPWLDDALLETVYFRACDRVVGVGRTQRLFRGGTRRAVEVRDRECFDRYCEEPAERCEIDHVVRWSDGGVTDPGNGRPGCAFHNRLREKDRRRAWRRIRQHE